MTEFETLDVWKRAAALSAHIYQDSRHLKDFGFKDQITRSGLSISSNIAEGYERGSYKQYIYFLRIAKGSAGELRSQIYVGMKIGYIKKETGIKWIGEIREISKMLYSLIESINKHVTN